MKDTIDIECPNCGRTIRSNVEKCPHCHASLDFQGIDDLEKIADIYGSGKNEAQPEDDGESQERKHILGKLFGRGRK